MRYSISDTAEYGDLTRGPRLINDAVRAEMQTILDEIRERLPSPRSGSPRTRPGGPGSRLCDEEGQAHQIETVGQELRAMMPFISAGKTRVQDASGG